ncbi:hypothetical protein HBH49_201660 [Parastagonospora nodorum]|nr:hypothetical protein HBH49_201660 [Parastagonospora nodorum]
MCNSMPTSLIKELGARHSLSNLSVYDLVEEFARHRNYSLPCKLSDLYKAGTSLVIDTLTVTPIKDNNNLLNTIDSHIKLRKLKEVMLLCQTIKSLSILSADKYSKKHLKVREADASKQVDANVREEENKNCSSLYYSDNSLLDSDDYCLDSSSNINPEDNSEDEEATIAKDLAREQKKRLKALLNAKIRDSLSARKNKVVVIDPANSTLCDLSDLLVIRFCIFSNSALENIGILTNKEVVEMQTNTATALANKLAAVNKLVRLQTFTLKILEHANMPAMHSKATKHYLALSAAQFALVYSFRKVDRYVFRADNTISVTAQRIITRKGILQVEINIILLPSHVTLSFIRIFESITKDTNGKHRLCLERGSAVDKVTGKHTYKTYINGLVINRQWRDVVANIRCSADQFKALDSRKAQRIYLTI